MSSKCSYLVDKLDFTPGGTLGPAQHAFTIVLEIAGDSCMIGPTNYERELAMIVNTQYRTSPSGKGQIVARHGGKQRTMTYDHAKSVSANHGAAAGVLLREAFNWSEKTLDDHHFRIEERGEGKTRIVLIYLPAR